jgi:hypothetical protein
MPLLHGPHFNGMVCEGIVTIFAGIVLPAALHLDRDDIDGRVIVCATRFTIEFNAEYAWSRLLHGYRVEEFRGKADPSRIWKT